MKRLLTRFSPTTGAAANSGQRRILRHAPTRLRFWLLLLCGALILALGMSATFVVAQSDQGLKQQEDQLIRKYTLPSSPSEAPVYKPKPTSPSKPRKQSVSPPRRQSAPPPQRRSDPEPPPQQRQDVAPRPAAPPAREAPPPRRPEPVQEAAPPRRPEPVQEAPPPVRRRPEPVQEPPDNSDFSDVEPDIERDIEPDIERDIEPDIEFDSEESARSSDRLRASEPLPAGQYVMEFNRSPVVGNRFRLRGIYSEARIGFTRPRGWKMKSAKALIRFQHSPALFANRSNLTLRVNDTSVGSVPLNRKEAEVGSMLFNIPSSLIQDYNELVVVAQQNNDPKCSDPSDPTLWTEILPDSKLVFGYQPQAIPLSFSRYPYPFFDELSLEANQIVYLLPKLNKAWLTAAARFQAALGRRADFRPIETRLVEDIDEVDSNERLVIIGTPAEQPALKSLKLPFKIAANQLLDGSKVALPNDVGVLMLTTIQEGGVPVLVVTGNAPEGVAKAAQFLVQPDTSKLGTGQAILVNSLKDVPTPSPRQWSRYLPEKNTFQLSELKTPINEKPFGDITVRGSSAPPIEIDFRALPDDQFTRGSSMTLRYSYGPQVNPRLSAIEVLLDNVFIGGARLTSQEGERRKTLKVDLPANLIKPTSKIQVFFRLNPREPGQCGKINDSQLTGTLHADTSFKLNREQSVQLPNLELLKSGYPFAAPQDLSSTALVVPDSPSNTELLTLLAFSERLGRLSQSDSVKLAVHTKSTLPSDIRKSHHLVGIGTREEFPFPKVFESGGFRLSDAFLRQSSQSSIQTLPDKEGMIQQVISPENGNRVLLALSAQTEEGLERVRQIISKDPWFFQLKQDTVLISSDQENPPSYDPNAYKLEFLQRAPSRSRLENTNLLSKVSRYLQENWFLLPAGILGIALLLYGITQLYLKRITDKKSH